MAKLRFEIEGVPGDVNVRTYMHALWDALSVLRELDSAHSGKMNGSINWYIAHQESPDSLAIVLRSQPKPLKNKKAIPPDVGPRVAASFITGRTKGCGTTTTIRSTCPGTSTRCGKQRSPRISVARGLIG